MGRQLYPVDGADGVPDAATHTTLRTVPGAREAVFSPSPLQTSRHLRGLRSPSPPGGPRQGLETLPGGVGCWHRHRTQRPRLLLTPPSVLARAGHRLGAGRPARPLAPSRGGDSAAGTGHQPPEDGCTPCYSLAFLNPL